MESETLYQMYFDLGPNRTIAELSRLTGKSTNALFKVSSKHHWKSRIVQDTYLKNQKDLGLAVSDPETALSEIAGDSLLKLRESIRTLKPNSARDAKALLEIYLLLQGRATVITGQEQQGDSDVLEFVLSILTPEQLAQVGEWAAPALNNPSA